MEGQQHNNPLNPCQTDRVKAASLTANYRDKLKTTVAGDLISNAHNHTERTLSARNHFIHKYFKLHLRDGVNGAPFNIHPTLTGCWTHVTTAH